MDKPPNKDLCANHPPPGWLKMMQDYALGIGPEPDWCTAKDCPPNPGYRFGNRQPMRKCKRRK